MFVAALIAVIATMIGLLVIAQLFVVIESTVFHLNIIVGAALIELVGSITAAVFVDQRTVKLFSSSNLMVASKVVMVI